jgi:AhpD family alkylhydroperoxidase
MDRVLVDKQHPEIYRALLDVAKAVRAAAASAGLDRRLVELVNLRVSQLNGCAFCLDVHTAAAVRAGETAQRLAVLPAWRATDLFSDKEKAALTLAESATTLPDAATQDEHYAFAQRTLSPTELSTVVWIATSMNAFNRVSILSRHPVYPKPSRFGTEPRNAFKEENR